MPVLARLESYYDQAKATGWEEDTHVGWRGNKYSKEECQAAYDFIVSGQMPERMCDLPKPLQRNLKGRLEVPTRLLGKEADAACSISAGTYAMSRTAKDVDAPCKDPVESRLPDLIAALENRLRELGRGR